jgi:hypothetical protein
MRSTKVRRAAWVLLVGLLPLTCGAEQGPYYIGFQQTFGYDSNIFRLPDRTQVGSVVLEPQSSGLISTTLLLAGIDQPIGRQRLYGDLSAGYTSYGSQSQLDNPTYRLVAGLDWDTLEKFSGNFELQSGRRLGGFGDRNIPTGQGDNDERYDRAALVARLGDRERSRAWLEADVVWDRLRNDVDYLTPVPVTTTPPLRETDGYERKDESVALGFGVRYRWLGSTIVGVGLRTESRDLEVARRLTNPVETVPSSLESRRNDIDLFVDHRIGDLHDLRARLSYGNRDYDSATVADFDKWSGDLVWRWRPTAKVNSRLRLLYDTEDRAQGASSAADSGGNQQTTALEWTLDYAITGKVSAQLAASYYQRDHGVVNPFTDNDRSVTLAMRWQVLRSTALGCSVGTARRSSTLDAALGRNAYDATLANCYVQAVLR